MERLRPEGNAADIAAAGIVVTVEIALQHELAAPQHDQAVKVPGMPIRDGPVEPGFEIGGKTGRLRRHFWPGFRAHRLAHQGLGHQYRSQASDDHPPRRFM